MTASVLFPLLALFLKYFRKIVSEKLHPCPHFLNIANNYCLLQIYYLHFILGGLIFMGKKSAGFLESILTTCTKYRKIWKNALNLTRYLISIFAESFDSYEHVLATSLEKRKTNFPRLYSSSNLYSHYGISNILLHDQNASPRNSEIFVRWFLLKSVLE